MIGFLEVKNNSNIKNTVLVNATASHRENVNIPRLQCLNKKRAAILTDRNSNAEAKRKKLSQEIKCYRNTCKSLRDSGSSYKDLKMSMKTTTWNIFQTHIFIATCPANVLCVFRAYKISPIFVSAHPLP